MIVLISEAAGLKWLTWNFSELLKNIWNILFYRFRVKNIREYMSCALNWAKIIGWSKQSKFFGSLKKDQTVSQPCTRAFQRQMFPPWDLYSEKLGSYRKSLKKVGLIRVWNVWRVKKGSPSWNSCHAPFCIDFWKYKIMQMLIDLTHNEIIDLTLLAQLLFDSYRQFQKLNFSKNLPNLFAVKDFLFLDILESLKTWFLTLTYFEQLKTWALGILCWVQWGF